ncbi:IS66 family transposase, partial [Verminephrobacter aporrectodeae subsp. tuberculatae]
LNPRVQSNGRRGRIKQSKAANLIGRLRDYSDDVWRFMTEPNVPFTNNLAEQAVRMPKVKQKISGCFRTSDGADIYCIIRSYLATLNKQGAKLFDALTQAFLGSPVQPRFG